MNYSEARAFIEEVSLKGSELGLTSITNLMQELGNPQDDLKFIHIAGTNGKGSVLNYLYTVLQKAGYRVGRYISPTLFSYLERIQINAAYIGRDDFARLVTMVSGAMDRMREKGLALPTVFEVETAVSFLYFKEQNCDLVLLEVGMGGRLDATNIIRTPVLTVLTSISMDHMEYLGNTLAEIAWNKAGIIKDGVPVVSARQNLEVVHVIADEAAKKGSQYYFVNPARTDDLKYGLEEQHFSYGDHRDMTIHLAGLHQIENAELALIGIDVLRRQGFTIPENAVREGFSDARWKGRFTVIHKEPYVIIDGAHNPDAALRLRIGVEKYFGKRKKYFIFGVFSDKEYDTIINITAGLAEHIYTVQTPDNPRALPAKELMEAVKRVKSSVEAADSIQDAVCKAMKRAQKEDVIIAFGSLSILAEIEKAVIACDVESE